MAPNSSLTKLLAEARLEDLRQAADHSRLARAAKDFSLQPVVNPEAPSRSVPLALPMRPRSRTWPSATRLKRRSLRS